MQKTGTTLCILIYSLFVLLFFFLFTSLSMRRVFFPFSISRCPSMCTGLYFYFTLRFVSCPIYLARWLILFSISSVFVCIRVWLSNFSEARRKWFEFSVCERVTKRSKIRHNTTMHGKWAWGQAREPQAKENERKKVCCFVFFLDFLSENWEMNYGAGTNYNETNYEQKKNRIINWCKI